MLYIKKRRSLLLLVPLLALLASCKTMPVLPDPLREETAPIPLEPGALIYLLADVKAARPILDLIPIQELNAKESKQMLDRTRSAAAALYPPESGRRFQLTGWGSYPSFQADMAFGTNKYWKKQRSAGGLPYWYSEYSRLSIALKPGQVFVLASLDNAPAEPFTAASGIEAPEGFAEFRRGALLSCWLENPGPTVNRIFTAMQFPLQLPAERIFVSLFSASGQKDQYQALLRIQTPSAAQARALVTLFSLARAFIAGGAPDEDASLTATATTTATAVAALTAALFANPPVQDGQNLNIKTTVLTEKEIALLFNLFSVYSG
jgi:hypothetical protein